LEKWFHKKPSKKFSSISRGGGNGFNNFSARKSAFAALLACGMIFPAPVTLAAEEVQESAPTSEGVVIAEISDGEKVLPAAETNKDTLNYMELVDSFVTAERIPSSRWDTPATVYVITSQEIEDNHYQDLAEALSHVNGVVGINYGSNYSGVLLNGNERVLLLIDGRRANNSQTSFWQTEKADLKVIPSMKMIERIEIVKGGNSALYGSDAVGGVINIITKKGTINETTIDLNTGYWRKHNYEITNQGVIGEKFSWFVTGGLGKSRAYEHSGSTSGILDRSSDYSDDTFSIRLDNKFDDRNSLTLDTTHRSHHYHSDQSGALYNNFSISYNFKEGTEIPGWLRYFNNYKSTVTPRWGKSTSKLQGIEYQNGWQLGENHKLIAGFEWHQSKASYPSYEYEGEKFNNSAVYLQDTISLSDKWTVVPGVRYDHTSKFGHQWSPKIAANYRANEKTKVYASWGRVYRLPTIAEMYSDNMWILDYDVNNPYVGGFTENYEMLKGYGIRPEKGHTETIGVEHSFDDNTTVSVNFFNSNIKDALNWTPYHMSYFDDGEPLIINFAESIKKEKRRGFELTFSQNLNDNFGYNIGYSHTHVDDELFDVLNEVYVKASDDYGQPNGYRLGLHYQNRGLKANLLGVMASGLNPANTEAGTGFVSKKYAVFNFNVSYDMNPQATVYFKALNFNNQNYSNIGYTSHSPGRFLMAGFNYKF